MCEGPGVWNLMFVIWWWFVEGVNEKRDMLGSHLEFQPECSFSVPLGNITCQKLWCLLDTWQETRGDWN